MRKLSLAPFFAVAVILTAGTAHAQPDRQAARVVVVNADELAKLGPDQDLAHDVCEALGDEKAARKNFGQRHNAVTPANLVQLLIALSAPEDLNKTAYFNEAFAVAPITDFDAFVDGIDYGRVVGRDDQQWIVRVRVDPAEVDREKVIARAQATGRRPPGLDRLSPKRRSASQTPKIKLPPGFGPNSASKGLGAADEENLEVGDAVEASLGGLRLDGTYRGEETFDSVVELTNLQPLLDAIKDKRLKRRLSGVEHFELLLPVSRLTKKAAPQAAPEGAAIAARTWSDTTGKFSVIATFAGVSGDRVRLAKPNGKEILVPLDRLCDADRQYVQQVRSGEIVASAPASAASPAGESLRADWSGLRPIKGRDFKSWSFQPSAETPRVVAPAVASLNLETPPEVSTFGEELGSLFVAADGSSAIAVISNGENINERLYLQYLDFQTGKAEPLVALPEESQVLDTLPETRTVLLRPKVFGRDDRNGRLFVQRLESGRLTPLHDWQAAEPDAFFKSIKRGWLLSSGRYLTLGEHSETLVLWGANAKAEHTIPIPRKSEWTFSLGPSRRYLAVASNAAVVLIDTESAQHVATVEHYLGAPTTVAMDAGLQRLALWAGREVSAWDLSTGEQLFRLPAPRSVRSKSLDWVGDLLLIGGKYLMDAPRRVLLWQYEVASAKRSQHVLARAGRVYYAPESERGLPLYVASIEAPHDAARTRREQLGSPESLLIAKPGDPIYVTVDTDRGVEVEQLLKAAISKSLAESGYTVVDKGSAADGALEAAVICKAAPQQEVRVNMSRSPIPDSWDIVTRNIAPYVSRVAIRRGDTELWSDGWRAEPGHVIWINDGETLDDALNRLTSPDIDRLTSIRFASHLAKPGAASPEGAYGVSRLTSAGVVANHTGE